MMLARALSSAKTSWGTLSKLEDNTVRQVIIGHRGKLETYPEAEECFAVFGCESTIGEGDMLR